jgi:hypothetical protein
MYKLYIHLKQLFLTTPSCFVTSVPSSGSSYTKLENLLIHSRLYPFEVHEDGTEVSKHVGVVKYHTFKRVCNFLTTARYVTGQK